MAPRHVTLFLRWDHPVVGKSVSDLVYTMEIETFCRDDQLSMGPNCITLCDGEECSFPSLFLFLSFSLTLEYIYVHIPGVALLSSLFVPCFFVSYIIGQQPSSQCNKCHLEFHGCTNLPIGFPPPELSLPAAFKAGANLEERGNRINDNNNASKRAEAKQKQTQLQSVSAFCV